MKKSLKYLLLLLLSLTSVFFAEVIAGSYKYPLYELWGIFVVVPLYGLHTIVLLYVIKKTLGNRKVMFASLYFAGTIFGLYEAYLTKVLWVGLSPDSLIVFHIAIIDFLVLVFLWHPLMSFIIPSLVFEGFMTKDNYLYEGLPEIVKKGLKNKKVRISFFLVIGLAFSLNGVSPLNVLKSGFANAIPILLLYYFLRKKEIHLKYSLKEILPNKKEFIVFNVLLFSMYLVMGNMIQRDVLTLINQIIIWVIYLFFAILFYKKLKNNKLAEEYDVNEAVLNFNEMIIATLIIIISGAIFSLDWLFGFRDTVMVVVYLTWAVLGTTIFWYTVIKKPIKQKTL